MSSIQAQSGDGRLDKPGGELRVLVIVPAYNEAGSIAEVVTKIIKASPVLHVLVVDDGSVDATYASVPKHDRVTAIRLPFNLGIGGAVQTGYRFAANNHFDIAIQVDGDGQHPPDQISKLIDHMTASEADLVIGSRFLPESGAYRAPKSRRSAIKLLGSLIRLLTGGQRVTDCTSGFRAANKSVLRSFAYWYPEDYPEPEVIVALHRAGYVVEEVPVDMKQRETGTSSISFLDGMFYVIKVGFAIILTTIRNPWPKERINHT
ncbi:glycosyltransferase family 2 protein [Poriferisphaera sp. WC338]|uniref:glycosyltransferase family 2 protein n=1 Tax=Poriferisphaera sp. WC338 TaxID=3425129 RepID=UPI003D818396